MLARRGCLVKAVPLRALSSEIRSVGWRSSAKHPAAVRARREDPPGASSWNALGQMTSRVSL